ncbi:hypothetical protein ADUPG1_006006 [Aduncisulcus paluster]|uniref:EamA domain-containing protein n=1 Tax=Aduncisulcus paluster TaxID=2918883 RepID=A0ABQ5KGF9_9EUKA|nr:hypothetical protein ADUPG1_006006 [Aduncisulcus paluster]
MRDFSLSNPKTKELSSPKTEVCTNGPQENDVVPSDSHPQNPSISDYSPTFLSIIIAYLALILARFLGAGVAVISNQLAGQIDLINMLFFRELFGFLAHIPLYVLRPSANSNNNLEEEDTNNNDLSLNHSLSSIPKSIQSPPCYPSDKKLNNGSEHVLSGQQSTHFSGKRASSEDESSPPSETDSIFRIPPKVVFPVLAVLCISNTALMFSYLSTAAEASVTLCGIGNAVSPVLTAAMAIVLGKEQGSCTIFIAVIIGVIGSIISLGDTIFGSSSGSGSDNSSSTLGLLSLVSYVLFSVLYFLFSPSIYSKAKIHPFEVMFWVYGVGVILSLATVLVFTRDTFFVQCRSFGWQQWSLLFGMGALGTTGLWGATAYASAVLRSPTIVHAFSMLSVIVNMVSGILLANETPSMWEIGGGILVMLGVGFLIIGKANPNKKNTKNKINVNDDSIDSGIASTHKQQQSCQPATAQHQHPSVIISFSYEDTAEPSSSKNHSSHQGHGLVHIACFDVTSSLSQPV